MRGRGIDLSFCAGARRGGDGSMIEPRSSCGGNEGIKSTARVIYDSFFRWHRVAGGDRTGERQSDHPKIVAPLGCLCFVFLGSVWISFGS